MAVNIKKVTKWNPPKQIENKAKKAIMLLTRLETQEEADCQRAKDERNRHEKKKKATTL